MIRRSITVCAVTFVAHVFAASQAVASAPPADPVPPAEVDYLEQAFTIHATTLSSATELIYVACDAEWAADGSSITGTCFGQSGTQILSSLVVHTTDGVTVIPVGLYALGAGWDDPTLVVEAEAPPLPTPGTSASEPAVATIAPTAPTTAPAGPATTFGDGTWLVGTDIAPGQYRAPGGDGCYWARLADLSGEDIIANEFSDTGSQVLVEIAATDVAFETDDCGTWEPLD